MSDETMSTKRLITEEQVRDAIRHCQTDGVDLSQSWLLAVLEDWIRLRARVGEQEDTIAVMGFQVDGMARFEKENLELHARVEELDRLRETLRRLYIKSVGADEGDWDGPEPSWEEIAAEAEAALRELEERDELRAAIEKAYQHIGEAVEWTPDGLPHDPLLSASTAHCILHDALRESGEGEWG